MCVWPVSRVLGVLGDFVLCDYCDHVVVVCVDVCGCCDHACHGNVLVLGDCMLKCVCSLAGWSSVIDVVYCVYNVVCDVVGCDVCCCCTHDDYGDLFMPRKCIVVCMYAGGQTAHIHTTIQSSSTKTLPWQA